MKDYKKLLEGVVNIINTAEKSDIAFVNICSYIGEKCLELQDSKDEKMWKLLKKYVHYNISDLALEADHITREQLESWLDKQGDKDELIKWLDEYKAKYMQEVLEKHLRTMNKDDERLRKTTIAFLKDFAEQGYENAVECIDWLEKAR